MCRLWTTIAALAAAAPIVSGENTNFTRFYTYAKGARTVNGTVHWLTCNDICAVKVGRDASGTCASDRMDKVNTKARLTGVMSAIRADGDHGSIWGGGVTHGVYQQTPMACNNGNNAIYLPVSDTCCSSCSAGPISGCAGGWDRLCCCPLPGEDPATVCAVMSSDCRTDTVWDQSTSRCLPCPASTATAQHAALVDLFTATKGAAWHSKLNWNTGSSPTSYCGWNDGNASCASASCTSCRGVCCGKDQSTIRSIDLSNNNLVGALPSSLFANLDGIESIDLHGNLISDIPDDICGTASPHAASRIRQNEECYQV